MTYPQKTVYSSFVLYTCLERGLVSTVSPIRTIESLLESHRTRASRFETLSIVRSRASRLVLTTPLSQFNAVRDGARVAPERELRRRGTARLSDAIL